MAINCHGKKFNNIDNIKTTDLKFQIRNADVFGWTLKILLGVSNWVTL